MNLESWKDYRIILEQKYSSTCFQLCYNYICLFETQKSGRLGVKRVEK